VECVKWRPEQWGKRRGGLCGKLCFPREAAV